ncbi:MAG: protein-methionine-sulfoxide reductase catalytic subunit MsrP [Nitrospinae bacterium]|nr:protein-methionine-sulfoxide reductase catalytic subunit MsrP [Nitrospinota bacterium]
MFGIKIPRSWDIRESEVVPEEVYLNRRKFLRKLGETGMTVAGLCLASGMFGLPRTWAETPRGAKTPAKKKRGSAKLLPPSGEAVTPDRLITRYNNFYEFGDDKAEIWRLAKGLRVDGWTVKVSGLTQKPRTLDVGDLLRKMPLEDRIYRLRCVETWSAVIPWTGFPLKELVRILEPLSSARYVKFATFLDPNLAPGQKERFWEPWPYTEGLSMEEAMHELAFMATGMYGHPLTPQNGAPIRLAVPWKYGFKSLKSIAAIEFTREPPDTFWQSVSPLEYDFPANVDPNVPYARWDQRFERPLGQEEMRPTRSYNGYAEQVVRLYA